MLRPELAAVLGATRFLQEIKVTAGLQHPHIFPLFDSGEADGFLSYVMPYVEGKSLRNRLKREGPLDTGSYQEQLPCHQYLGAAAHPLAIRVLPARSHGSIINALPLPHGWHREWDENACPKTSSPQRIQAPVSPESLSSLNR